MHAAWSDTAWPHQIATNNINEDCQICTITYGNGLLVAELKGLDTPDDFVHVPSDTRGIIQAEHELVLGVDDEHRPNRQRERLLVAIAGVDHSVSHGNRAILISDDGKLDLNLVLTVCDNIL